MGGAKTELKLLACQRKDSWSAVAGEELVSGEEAGNFSEGALVVIELGSNKQVQGKVEPATSRILSLMQQFGRLLEKSADQEKEIEEWRESLQAQMEAIQQKEEEMYVQLDQIDEAKEELERLEAQKEEVEKVRQESEQYKEEAEKLREEFERKSQELEGAWEHLRGEQRKLEDLQNEVQPAGVGLDEEQARRMKELVEYLSSTKIPLESLQEDLNQALGAAQEQQTNFGDHWQQLEQKRGEAQVKQGEIDSKQEDINQRRQEFQESLIQLEEKKQDLLVQQKTLGRKEESVARLKNQLEREEELYEQLSKLAQGETIGDGDQSIDTEALESMTMEELQTVVDELQQDFDRRERGVKDQEEELKLQRQDVEELQEKLEGANALDKTTIEEELADAQEAKKMLDESFVGTLRNLKERESVLNKHIKVLRRRQGIVDNETGEQNIDLQPVLSKLEEQKQQQGQELQALEEELQLVETGVQQLEEEVKQITEDRESKQSSLKELEEILQQEQVSVAQIWSQVNFYEESLQPLQDNLDQTKEKLEGIVELVTQFKQTEEYQLQAVGDLRQIVEELSGASE